ncbi:MAG TPA: BrnT family toxin [Bryobacteraceae bacterium]
MNGSDAEFDWDDANVGHLARHHVTPEEAEQVILGHPLDLGMQIIEGEDRFVNLGSTQRGRILLVVTTWRQERVRVVTAFEPIKRLVQFYYQERGR